MPKSTARRRWLLPLAACLLATPAFGQNGVLGGLRDKQPPAAQQQAAGVLPEQMVFKRVTLTDPNMNSMPSHTILVPDGWSVEGGAWWPGQGFSGHMPSHEVKLVSPEGFEIELSPDLNLRDYRPHPGSQHQRPGEGMSDEKGLPILYMPDTLEAWEAKMLQNNETAGAPGVTNYRITQAAEIPGVSEQVRQQAQQMLAQSQQQMGPSMDPNAITASAGGAALMIGAEYEQNGRPMEEASMFVTSHSANHFNFMGYSKYYWTVSRSITMRGAADTPEAVIQLGLMAATSLQPTPGWARMRAEHMAVINGMNKASDQAIAAINTETNRYISDLQQRSYENRMASNDKLADQTINALTDREDYVIPGTSDYVNLPSGYDHAHYGSDGTIILTNDAMFDPSSDPELIGTSFQTMQVRR